MKNPNYRSAVYTVEIELSKPPIVVFNHVINLSTWWPEEFTGEPLNLHREFIFKTGEGHYSKNKVIEYVPGQKIVWITTESMRKTDLFDWTGTKMIFELTAINNHTRLQFTYDGVVPESETDRLARVCDFVIKEKLYNLVESFTVILEIPKSTLEVFNCIQEVPKWWSRDFEGSSSRLNDEFIIHHPNRHYSKQKLVEVIPGSKITWLVTESTLHWLQVNPQEWTNTKMIFVLSMVNGKTVLQFTHEGLVPAKECYEMCAQGWSTVILDRLYHYILSGKEI